MIVYAKISEVTKSLENTTKNEQAIEEQEVRVYESRSVYQKQKRVEEKQRKRKSRRRIMLIISIFVILAGILCGVVLADTMNASHNTVEIASANAQYVKHTMITAVGQVAEKIPWNAFSLLLDKLDNEKQEEKQELNDPSHSDAVDKIENDTGSSSNDLLETPNGIEQTTTESAIIAPKIENPYGIDPSKPMIALTFDDGPSKHTWTIVSALQQHNARATFFLVGNRIANYQAAIDFTLANHNEVASHSFSHANLAKCAEEEILTQIQSVDEALQSQHEYTPTLFRVPYGERNEQVLEFLREQGKPVIGWSVDPRDWDVQDKDKIVKHVLSHVKDGDIVLMHDLYKPTADAVVELIPELQKRGYQLVTVSELFQYKGIPLEPGAYYYATWK